jgi:hypothetical protein
MSLIISFIPPYDQYAKNLYTLGYIDGVKTERERIVKELKKKREINVEELGFSKRLQAKGL